MQRTIFDTPLVTVLAQRACLFFTRLFGWRLEAEFPTIPKYVLVVAPHTSNWDALVMLSLGFAFRLKAFYMAKASLFWWPLGPILRWVGGLPIDRSAPQSVVDQCVKAFEEHDQSVLAILPEGTRKKVTHWKTGFYRIAVAANVPIVLAYVDYRRKVGGLGPTIEPTGDFAADMAIIRDFYTGITAKHPERTAPPAIPSGE